MLKFWVRSISLGLLAAIAIIMVTPSLRAKLMPVVEQPRNIGALQISFNEAVRKAAPAVVNIYNRKYSENDRRKLSIQGLGSGVIVSEKGYIITNYHVVAQADQIVVALQDGRAAAAQLVGKDRRTDIAVLRVEGTGLPVIPLNPDYHPKVGDVVLAIGNPYNLGQTTTFGIISATGRSSISADGRLPSRWWMTTRLYVRASLNYSILSKILGCKVSTKVQKRPFMPSPKRKSMSLSSIFQCRMKMD